MHANTTKLAIVKVVVEKNSVPADIVENEVIQFTKQLLGDKEFAIEIKYNIGNSLKLEEIQIGVKSIKKNLKIQKIRFVKSKKIWII